MYHYLYLNVCRCLPTLNRLYKRVPIGILFIRIFSRGYRACLLLRWSKFEPCRHLNGFTTFRLREEESPALAYFVLLLCFLLPKVICSMIIFIVASFIILLYVPTIYFQRSKQATKQQLTRRGQSFAFRKSFFFARLLLCRICICHFRPVWPDWAIYCTLGNFSEPAATIILPKLPTF